MISSQFMLLSECTQDKRKLIKSSETVLSDYNHEEDLLSPESKKALDRLFVVESRLDKLKNAQPMTQTGKITRIAYPLLAAAGSLAMLGLSFCAIPLPAQFFNGYKPTWALYIGFGSVFLGARQSGFLIECVGLMIGSTIGSAASLLALGASSAMLIKPLIEKHEFKKLQIERSKLLQQVNENTQLKICWILRNGFGASKIERDEAVARAELALRFSRGLRG